METYKVRVLSDIELILTLLSKKQKTHEVDLVKGRFATEDKTRH